MPSSVCSQFDHALNDDTQKDEYQNLTVSAGGESWYKSGQIQVHRHDSGKEGLEEFHCVREGVCLRTLDFQTPGAQNEWPVIGMGGQLFLLFKLEGVNEFRHAGECSHSIKPGSLTLGYSNNDSVFTYHHVSGEHCRMVCIMITPQALFSPPFSQTRKDLPQIIREMFDHSIGWTLEGLNIGLDMVRPLHQLLDSDTSDSVHRAYIEAKVIELICLSLRAVMVRDNINARNTYSQHELNSLEKIQNQLRQQYYAPPPLANLAASAGMSESKLKRCFKDLFGVSTSELVLHLRMRRAKELLAVRDSNINQIADELGYSHACNFTTAFKRRYGLTPKAYQKQLLKPFV